MGLDTKTYWLIVSRNVTLTLALTVKMFCSRRRGQFRNPEEGKGCCGATASEDTAGWEDFSVWFSEVKCVWISEMFIITSSHEIIGVQYIQLPNQTPSIVTHTRDSMLHVTYNLYSRKKIISLVSLSEQISTNTICVHLGQRDWPAFRETSAAWSVWENIWRIQTTQNRQDRIFCAHHPSLRTLFSWILRTSCNL
jgi:hypothetical protein